jgi:hypothetical protein
MQEAVELADVPMSGTSNRDLIRPREQIPEDELELSDSESISENPRSKVLIIDHSGATMHQMNEFLLQNFPGETFEVLSKLRKGGISIRAENPATILQFKWEGILANVRIKTVVDRKAQENRQLVLKGVPSWIDEEEITSDPRFTSARRIYRKDKTPSLTMFVAAVNEETAAEIISMGRLRMFGNSWKVEPFINTRKIICRTCKTVNPRHNPGNCTKIRCGICSGNHATKDHPQDEETRKCPKCSQDDHEFKNCPQIRLAAQNYRKQQVQKPRKPSKLITEHEKQDAQNSLLLTHTNESNMDQSPRDLSIILQILELFFALDIINEDKRPLIEQLLVPLRGQKKPTFASVVEQHENTTVPNTTQHNQPRKKIRRNAIPAEDETKNIEEDTTAPSQKGWRTTRPCKYHNYGCDKLSTSGPIILHEKECPFQNGPHPTKPKPKNSSTSIQAFFPLQSS